MKRIIILLAAITCLCGCKTTKYVYVPEVRTDTLVITKQQRDSIWMHDSIYVSEKQKGDTIYLQLERWHTKYVEKELHDTIYQSKTDSVAVPYPVEVKVEKALSWWQKTRIHLGEVMLGLLLIAVGYGVYRRNHLNRRYLECLTE